MADDEKTPEPTTSALEEPTAQMGLRRLAAARGTTRPAAASDSDDATGPGVDEENDSPAVPPEKAAWRRMARALANPRVSGAGAIIALLIGLLGFGLIAQVRSNANESTLANDRPDDLVRILSDLDARKDRLTAEIAQLQETVRELTSGAQGRQAALAAAARRAEELGILAGTLGARGPGLIITLAPAANAPIGADILLDTVEELRGAGAEAMEVTGTGSPDVRIVASTSFVDAAGGISVDGRTIGGTIVVTAIGDPQTMQTALSIAGGVVDTVHNAGGTVQLDQELTVEVTALHSDTPLRYARPAS
jgi:uncharacterized protein YlxW (UPF0749 family)